MDYELCNDVFDEEDDSEDVQGAQWYDQYLGSDVGPLREVVSKVIEIVDPRMRGGDPRQRRRKARDQRAFEASVDLIVSNLAHVVIQSAVDMPLIVSRRTTARGMYANGSVPARTFVDCVDTMEAMGLLLQEVGRWNGNATTITPTKALRDMIQGHGVHFGCFRQYPDRPLLVLKRSTRASRGGKTKREFVGYTRDSSTDAMVSQVARLNAFLSQADITFIDDETAERRVDTINKRTLVRYFTIRKGQGVRFDQGGRLFGQCFWLTLGSDQRHRIRIGGEPVADLDFCNLGPRLVYAQMKKEPPAGDLYDLTGYLEGYTHSDPVQRKAIKRALASCFNGGAGGKRGAKPKGAKPGTRGILDGLPRGITAAKIRKALAEKHPDLAGLLEGCVGPQTPGSVPIGFSIMFDESRILLRALEILMDKGVVALPFHDGLMVARSYQWIAQEALQAASLEIVKVALPVTVKADYGSPGATEMPLAA